MKTNTLRNFSILGICAAAICTAPFATAQSVRHDYMDSAAARKDIRRLKRDRALALRTHNMGKVAQDDRLIAADRHFVRKDTRKVIRGGG